MKNKIIILNNRICLSIQNCPLFFSRTTSLPLQTTKIKLNKYIIYFSQKLHITLLNINPIIIAEITGDFKVLKNSFLLNPDPLIIDIPCVQVRKLNIVKYAVRYSTPSFPKTPLINGIPKKPQFE